MPISPSSTELDRILLIDDEEHLTSLWKHVLEITGRYTVWEENHGDRALHTARHFRPDLIFLDRHLCGVDGGEIAARLRCDDKLCSVPIVFVTGSVTRDEAALQSLLGGPPTLAKPFESAALASLAGAVLDQRRRPFVHR